VRAAAEDLEGRRRVRRKRDCGACSGTGPDLACRRASHNRIEVTGRSNGLIRDHVRPSAGARCGKAARRHSVRGTRAIAVPTATGISQPSTYSIRNHTARCLAAGQPPSQATIRKIEPGGRSPSTHGAASEELYSIALEENIQSGRLWNIKYAEYSSTYTEFIVCYNGYT